MSQAQEGEEHRTPTPAHHPQGVPSSIRDELVGALREGLTAMPPAPAASAVSVTSPMARVRRLQHVNSHLPIGWPEMPKGIIPKLRAYAQKIVRRLLRWYIDPIVQQQNDFNRAVADTLAVLVHDDASGTRLPQRFDALRLRVQRLEAQIAQHPQGEGHPTVTPSAQARGGPIDLYAVGSEFRGDADALARLHDYDDILQPLATSVRNGERPGGRVLDIGCGRGQFVVHLSTLGLDAYGIDVDQASVDVARQLGREVHMMGAREHLDGLDDASLLAATMIQVAEHMSPSELSEILALIAVKLQPGGLVIVETVNPTSFWSLSQAFLLDPSHRFPLHPLLLRVLVESAGFEAVQTRYLHPVGEGTRLQRLDDRAFPTRLRPLAQALNEQADRLNGVLFAAQDYATIGRKPEV